MNTIALTGFLIAFLLVSSILIENRITPALNTRQSSESNPLEKAIFAFIIIFFTYLMLKIKISLL